MRFKFEIFWKKNFEFIILEISLEYSFCFLSKTNFKISRFIKNKWDLIAKLNYDIFIFYRELHYKIGFAFRYNYYADIKVVCRIYYLKYFIHNKTILNNVNKLKILWIYASIFRIKLNIKLILIKHINFSNEWWKKINNS